MIPAPAAATSFHGQRCPVNFTTRLMSDNSAIIEWFQRRRNNVAVSSSFSWYCT